MMTIPIALALVLIAVLISVQNTNLFGDREGASGQDRPLHLLRSGFRHRPHQSQLEPTRQNERDFLSSSPALGPGSGSPNERSENHSAEYFVQCVARKGETRPRDERNSRQNGQAPIQREMSQQHAGNIANATWFESLIHRFRIAASPSKIATAAQPRSMKLPPSIKRKHPPSRPMSSSATR
jgi:hypothetical protein